MQIWYCLLIGLLVLAPLSVAAQDDEREVLIEYLYIDANEDQASGGHAAVRINEDVFHFQYDSGLLILVRVPWADFQLSYRGYQNRNIRASRLDISRDTYQLLRKTFIRRYLTHSRQVSLVEDARRDYALAQALAQQPTAAVELPGFGFFTRQATDAPASTRSSLLAAIEKRHGEAYLGDRRLALQRELAQLPVRAMAVSEQDFIIGTLPTAAYPFNQHYADTVAALHAIDVLSRNIGLSEQLLVTSAYAGDAMSLSGEDRLVLQANATALQQALVRLASSQRPDWGQAMLLGMARFQAINLSLEQGRWVFIDTLDADAAVIEVGSRTRKMLPLLEEDALALWLHAQQQWRQSSQWNEASYARLEAATTNLLELRRLAGGANDWRVRMTRELPRGIGLYPSPSIPDAFSADAEALLQEMEQSEKLTEHYATQELGYKLITKNCVSELFDTFDLAMAEAVEKQGLVISESTLAEETGLRLGEPFSPSPIPFSSARQVRKHWRISDDRKLPSLRRLYTRAQKEQKSDMAVVLRESNTLTSTVYHRSDQDSFFIFFTDGNALVRPALGLVNLTAALGATLVGAVRWPFDGGKSVKAGARGALFSLPELGFGNIRKGSNNWIAPELRTVPLEQ